MVSYDYYRVFCCAARRGSFSRAAEELMSSQPAVSHIIANLEQQLEHTYLQRPDGTRVPMKKKED